MMTIEFRAADARHFQASKATMRVPPHIGSVGLFAQSFSESVTSGKLKGSHLFASVIPASRKRA
jgi:hypothetical protein